MTHLLKFYILFIILQLSLQDCPEEYTDNGLRLKWSKTPNAFNVESDPICCKENNLVTRNCTDGVWSPAANELEPCMKVLGIFDEYSCPLNYHKISVNNSEYCYQISPASFWDFPCFTSGGASIITDLNENELNTMMDMLAASNITRYWLPAHRQNLFHPVVWYIPGPNWGQQVTNDRIRYHNSFWKNCLALDVIQRMIVTDSCMEKYPSLCFYLNNIHYIAVCPEGYHSFRYKPDNGTCYGIEKSDFQTGLTFHNFIDSKCHRPMSDDANSINRFIFREIAERSNLPDSEWCWFKTTNIDTNVSSDWSENLEGIINKVGVLGFSNSSSTLSCMACETEAIYEETELMFEFDSQKNLIYLTIYHPSGLWKYGNDDKGIQCFSDAEGFVGVINISELPYMSIKRDTNENIHEKIVYAINLKTNRSAQYWCEGHTHNFTFISTEKIIVNPKGKDIHVFSMTIHFYNTTTDAEVPDIKQINSVISTALNVKETLLRDILEITDEYVLALLHVHAPVEDIYENEAQNILLRYSILMNDAIQNLPSVNCSFVNLTSSVYCLPTSSKDNASTQILDWDLTPIAHISAPKQFCLQSNGLPVKRQCQGSYHVGSMWGSVEGECDRNYIPSEMTTFLYNVVIGQVSDNDTSSFLTDGLGFVLRDVDSIIPADIYYLSMSLKQITNMAQNNDTNIDIGDINNIAWVMDRVSSLEVSYMRLAQTLNSTNVILNSVNDIIEMIADGSGNTTTYDEEKQKNTSVIIDDAYQVAVQPQFIVQISFPGSCNVTGVALHKRSPTGNFTDMIITPLYANTSYKEVLAIENLEVATWVPAILLKSLRADQNETVDDTLAKNNLHIIVSIFQNDVVFQEVKNRSHVIDSRIVGISIPGFLPNLVYPLPIVFKSINETKSMKKCGFWDFQSFNSSPSFGLWNTKGCFPLEPDFNANYTICQCYHLTHFSQLMPIISAVPRERENAISQKHTKALNIITLVGSFLSISGVVGIWITAMVFSNWRRKAGTKVLLQLSTAIALPLVFIVISNLDNKIFERRNDTGYVIVQKYKVFCVVLGALLHYSILASFIWMLITAILQFVRYVRVLGVSRPSRFLFKCALAGWGIPWIPVSIVLSIHYEGYIPNASICKPICYPKGIYFMLGILLPISVILTVNIILFVLVLYSLARGSNDKMKSADMDLVCAQLRLSIFLFFLLGLTWIFGIFSFSKNPLWAYLFCLTATLQGFVLFIYFIICDPAARAMWIALVKPALSVNSSRNSITSITSLKT